MKNLRLFKTAKERRAALSKYTNTQFTHIAQYSFDEVAAGSRHCENMIGAVQVPLGISGPLRLRSGHAFEQENEYYIPLATTEGALVASINRGCKAITASGGAQVYAHRVGTTRGPVFYTRSLAKSRTLYLWLKQNEKQLMQTAAATSQHLQLKTLDIKNISTHVFVRCYFDTQDAMGMNMATIATQHMVELIEKETGARCISVAGNFDTDKKPAWLNFLSNRGYKVWAEVVIPQKVVTSVLKTTAQKIYDVWLSKCMYGSIMSGSLGFNAHAANSIAALFLATGQDIAHVSECSMGITSVEMLRSNSVHISVYLPDVMVGTVGGGTTLATQQEALSLLGVAGGNKGTNALRFAEIVGATVLAGEVSLLASLSQGTLAQSHQRLARGKK